MCIHVLIFSYIYTYIYTWDLAHDSEMSTAGSGLQDGASSQDSRRPAFAVYLIPAFRLAVQGYLAHAKQRPPRTLQEGYAEGPLMALRGGAVFQHPSAWHTRTPKPETRNMHTEI